MSNFCIFMMPILQIWPCHVTQGANFEKFYVFLILHLILGKAARFLAEKLSTSEVNSQKPHRGWKTPLPPVLLGLKLFTCTSILRTKRNVGTGLLRGCPFWAPL